MIDPHEVPPSMSIHHLPIILLNLLVFVLPENKHKFTNPISTHMHMLFVLFRDYKQLHLTDYLPLRQVGHVGSQS